MNGGLLVRLNGRALHEMGLHVEYVVPTPSPGSGAGEIMIYGSIVPASGKVAPRIHQELRALFGRQLTLEAPNPQFDGPCTLRLLSAVEGQLEGDTLPQPIGFVLSLEPRALAAPGAAAAMPS